MARPYPKHHRVSWVNPEGDVGAEDYLTMAESTSWFEELAKEGHAFVGRHSYSEGSWSLQDSTQMRAERDLDHLRHVSRKAVEIFEELAGELK